MRDTQRARRLSFWALTVLLALFLFAVSAPSTLYPLYAARWDFSPAIITAVYAVYAGGALAALLVAGRVSDYLGRRRVVVTALALQVLSMATFIVAHGVEFLFVARTLQGAATAVAAGAISAWLVDLQPREKPGLGGFVTGIALLAGLGTGAVGSGLLLQYASHPLRLIYWLLGGAFLIAILAVASMPEVVTRASGVLRSLRPQLGVPDSTRSTFTAVMPTLVAMWALAGLYLSLGPSLAITLLRTKSNVAGGFVILALMGSAALGAAFARRLRPRVAIIRGSLGMALGVAITIAAVVTESLGLLYMGSVIAGLALGPAFSGVMQTLGSLAPAEKRGALFGSIYIVIYVSISVPTVLAGVAVGSVPLQDTTYVYGLAVMILAGITSVAVTRQQKELSG